jgi:AcrR family transcriptional regulator
LIDEGRSLIGEDGSEGFTLREVARRVGVNHRAVYRHFQNKDDLLAAIAERGYELLVASMKDELTALGEARAPEQLMAMAHAYVDFAFAEPAFFTVMFGRRLNEEGRYPTLEIPIRAAATLLGEVLTRGQERGEIVEGPVRDLGLAFWSSMHGVASMTLSRRIRVKPALRRSYLATLMAPTIRGLTR